MNAPLPAEAAQLLDFWFLPAGTPGHGRYRPEWFGADTAFAEALVSRFGSAVDAALVGAFTDWETNAEGALARILLLDTFAQLRFRGSDRAYAGHGAALAAAMRLIESGRDKNLPPLQRWFVFMPFGRSEALIDQERAVALLAGLRRESGDELFELAYEDALHRRETIERFGRFPQRNALLGRASTADELAFLAQPGCPD